MFTCVLDTTNTDITNDNVQWYRFIKNTGTMETVDPDEDNINLLTIPQYTKYVNRVDIMNHYKTL